MTYTFAAVVAVLIAVAVDLAVLRTRLIRQLGFWASYAIVLVFQFVVNGILTGRDVVRYDPRVILGLRVFHAPAEDIAYGFALVLLTLSCWVALGRRELGRRERGRRPIARPTPRPPADGGGEAPSPAG